MDTKDQQSESVSPGVMLPDTTLVPTILTPDTGTYPIDGDQKKKSTSPLQDSLRRLRRDKRAMVSIGVIVFFIVLALIGPPIYQHVGGPYQSSVNGVVGPSQYHSFSYEELGQNTQDQLPSAHNWLGTDEIGRDILARLMQGVLISLAVALVVELVDIALGVLIGVLAGYYGGWIDQLLARFTDLMFAFPGLLFVILIAGIFGNWADIHLSKIPVVGPNGNARLLLVSLALAFTTWPLMARYVRGQTLQLKEQQFIEAARSSGTSSWGIIIRHIIPNLFSLVIVVATLDISNTIIGEAGISFLGLGVQAPGSSIGLMISAGSQQILAGHFWEVLVPCCVLAAIVLAFSFLGDGLRDAFDPKSKD